MSGIKFLVVDDASFARDLVKKTLRHHFPACTLTDAPDAKKAQNILKKEDIDLILSEWELTGMSGMEFLQSIRADEALHEIPFIMVTSLQEKKYIVEAVEAGVSDYLNKPYTAEDLVQKVSKVLKRSGKLQEAQKVGLGQGVAHGSIDALGAKTVDLSQAQPSQVAAQVATKAPVTTSNKEKSKPKGQAQLLFASGSNVQCLIREIDEQFLQGVIKKGDYLPALFDQLEISILQGGGSPPFTVKGYVHSLQAADNRIDCEFVKIDLRFTDNDAEIKGQLNKFITSAV